MFSDREISVGTWIIFWFIMAIPIINVIAFLFILFSSDTNKTLQNMLKAQIVLMIIMVLLFMTLLAPLWRQIIEIIQTSF